MDQNAAWLPPNVGPEPGGTRSGLNGRGRLVSQRKEEVTLAKCLRVARDITLLLFFYLTSIMGSQLGSHEHPPKVPLVPWDPYPAAGEHCNDIGAVREQAKGVRNIVFPQLKLLCGVSIVPIRSIDQEGHAGDSQIYGWPSRLGGSCCRLGGNFCQRQAESLNGWSRSRMPRRAMGHRTRTG